MADLARLHELLDAAFADDEAGEANDAVTATTTHPLHRTDAFVALQHGQVVAERYGPGFDVDSTFISWSMAKSMLSAVCGILVKAGRLDIDQPAPVAQWQIEERDPRRAITIRQLLQMRSGLDWVEDYVDDSVSDVIEMLFGGGASDSAGFAASKPLGRGPGEPFNYSSGTSNIVARIVGDIIGGGETNMRSFLADELFGPLGMSSAEPKFDTAGTWIASSFVYATARDFAAFGELYRNDGVVDGQRLLPEGWVDESIASHATDIDSGQGYGLHWWIANDGLGTYAANGYEGQRIQVTPAADLVIVRLGKTPAEHGTDLRAFYRATAECFMGTD